MVKDIIQSVIPVSSNSMNAIEELVEYESVEKGKTFIKRNQVNFKEYFILDGVCRSYLISPQGEEITISFFTSNSVLSPYVTRTSNGRSILYFQALTNLQTAAIDAAAFEGLMIENQEIKNFGHKVLQNELLKKVEKEIGLASLTAKERLIKFREEYPMLENQIPHSDIASYLGITNISLSRLRRDLMR